MRRELALDQREDAEDGERGAEQADGAARQDESTLPSSEAGPEEGPLEVVEVVAVPRSERLCLVEAGATVEVAALTPFVVPSLCRVSEFAMDTQGSRIFFDPGPELGPAADQRLVGDIDDLLAGVGLGRTAVALGNSFMTASTASGRVRLPAGARTPTRRDGVLCPLAWLA